MKKIICLILVLILITGIVFAGGQKAAKDYGGKKHIVFVTPLFSHPVWLVAKEGFEAAAKKYDFVGDWVGPTIIDADEMIKQIEVAIAEKADGIITQGMNPEAMVPVLKKAAAAGIPVVVVDSDIPDAPRLGYLGMEPITTGKIGGESILKKLNGKAPKVAYMTAALDYNIGNEMIASYKNTLSKQSGYVERAIVEDKSDMFVAIQKWQDLFTTHPDINVAVSVTSEGGPACAKVLQELGIKDKVIIMSMDDIEETVDGIRNESIYGTVTGNFFRLGYQSASWLVDYLDSGKKPPALINDCGQIVVTKENLDTYSRDMKNPDTWN
jgi:ABC-type sugar transport system substrate-binding protein